MKGLITDAPIEQRIYFIRGYRIMLDRDLAKIYGVSTGRLNQQVKRNRRRFPDDFMFQLSKKEMADWVSQNAISNPWARKGLRKTPYAFTEHGAVMLAAVLNSDVAIAASLQIVRAFNRLRQMALTHKDLTYALMELARKVANHDERFEKVFAAIHELTDPLLKTSRQVIGFKLKPE